MKAFLYLISIFWILAGTAFILFPLKSKALYTNLIKPIKALFILPLLIGVLFLWANPASRLEAFIKVLGIIALIKGIFILACPINVIKSIFNFWLTRPDVFYRFYGVFIILLGVIVG
ncbi:MAG: hypothetical protein Q8O12_00760 [Candidatus Omnitrophota bacterium]|nr:hypothetical protein [Candidatus Omnitrophota bacterium]